MTGDLPKFRLNAPGLFVTATDTEIGKTTIAAAIATALRQSGRRVGVLKPVATGCSRRRDGLVSEDAEMLAAAAEPHQSPDLICPNRYAEPVAPSIAARREGRPIDYAAIGRSLLQTSPDAWVIEGAGGVLTPLDERHTVRDLIAAFGTPAVVVASCRLGTINHTLMSIEALRSAGVDVVGVVLNRYPAEAPGVAQTTAAAEIERHGRVAVLAVVPEERVAPPRVPPGIADAVGRVDWPARLRRRG